MITYDKDSHNVAIRDIEKQICTPGSFYILKYTKTS